MKRICRLLFKRFLLGLALVFLAGAALAQARTAPLAPPSSPPFGLEKPSSEGGSVFQCTPVYSYKVIQAYPHDPQAFTQGLVYTNSVLYEGTGIWGQSSLRRVDLETGEVLQIYHLPDQYFGEGIVVYGQKIIQLTWQSGIGFVYDRDSFELLDTFNYPTEGWGITHDGQRLIMSDGTSTLYFWDPETYQEIGQVQVYDDQGPVNRLNELEYIQGEVYANVWQTDRIARIDPTTGQVVAWIDLEGLLDSGACDWSGGVADVCASSDSGIQAPDVLNGIAYDVDNDRLFVTGKRWPTLFEIELMPTLGPNAVWTQVNADGFGDADNTAVAALEPFAGFLHAGTVNRSSGAQIWRSADGFSWNQVISPGFSYTNVTGIDDLVEFSGTLWASTYLERSVGPPRGGEIWRSPNGLDWTRVISDGFGDVNNERIRSLVWFSDTLYAGTDNLISGAQVWRTTDGSTWQQSSAAGFGNVDNTDVGAFAVFSGSLFAGTWNSATGAEMWRTEGMTWTPVITGGLGVPDNVGFTSLAVFTGQLYALTYNPATGSEVWRSADGLSWTNVVRCGLGNPFNESGGGLIVFEEQLFLVAGNQESGAEVWRTADGVAWEQIGFVGWDDRDNVGSNDSRAVAVFGGRLFVGTVKSAAAGPRGGEVWLYLHHSFYLPLVEKNGWRWEK